VVLEISSTFEGGVLASNFNVGDLVEGCDSAGLKVRDAPAGDKILGTESYGAHGIIRDGPQTASLSGTTYTWWKIQWEDGLVGWSAEGYPGGVYYIKKVPPNPPTATSPGSDSGPGPVIDTLTPTLQWQGSFGADYYALAISEYPYGSSNIIYNPQVIYGTSHIVPTGRLQLGKKYRWNLQAHSSGGLSAVSNTLYFQTPLPDLIVEDIWIQPSTFTPSSTVTVYTRIKNIGQAEAVSDQGLGIKAYFDSNFIHEDAVEGLGPGYTYTFQWSYAWPSDTNRHIIKVVVDPSNIISESNENNNELSREFTATYTVTFYTSPSNVGSITFSSNTYTNGQSAQYQVNTYTVTANVPSGYTFSSWSTSGGVSVTSPSSASTIATVSSAGSITANFVIVTTQYAITFYTNPNNIGSITFSGTTYTNGQSGQYQAGQYSVTANAPQGYQFSSWSTTGGVSITGSTATVSSAGSITANFQVPALPTLSVQVTANPSSITTSQSSAITVTVTSGGSTIQGASVSLSITGGALTQTSGTTDSNGRFTSTFSSGATGTFTVTASASKSGYNSGSGSTQVVVSAVPPPSLSAPSGLSATAVSSSQINLAWTDNSADESDFHIERRTSGGSWTEIATVSANTQSYSDTGLDPSTTYYYRVRDHRHSDNMYSDWSNEASATTQSGPLPNLEVQLMEPFDGATLTSSPVTLKARATSGGNAVQGATVKFYVDGTYVGSASSDSNGYASISYPPSHGSHNWYATAEKSGYNSGTCSTWSFTYSAQFDFSISVLPSSGTVTAGQSATYSVTVSLLSGTTQTVSLSLSGQHSSMSYNFNPASGSPTFTSTLTVSTASSTPTNTYTLNVTGTGGGVTRQQQVTLIVQAARALPVAKLSASPTVLKTGQTVDFDASGSYDPDGSVVSYFFDYGDGSNSGWISSSRVEHRYIKEMGLFQARVKVRDNHGIESDWSPSITIRIVTIEVEILNLYEEPAKMAGFIWARMGLIPLMRSVDVEVHVFIYNAVPDKVDLILQGEGVTVDPLLSRKESEDHYVFRVSASKLLSWATAKDLGFYVGRWAAKLDPTLGFLASEIQFLDVCSKLLGYINTVTREDAYLMGVALKFGDRELIFPRERSVGRIPTIGDALRILQDNPSLQARVGELLIRALSDIITFQLESPAHISVLDENETLVGRYAIYTGKESHPETIILFNGSGTYRVIVYAFEGGNYNLTISYMQGNYSKVRSFYEKADLGMTKEYCIQIYPLKTGKHFNFMPIIHSILLPESIGYGDQLSVGLNASDPEGIGRVDVALLDPVNGWHNKTADYDGGLYQARFDAQGFLIGGYEVYISILDREGFVSTQVYNLRVLGRLALSGTASKTEPISGENITVVLTLRDQDEKPVGFAVVNVTFAGKTYRVKYIGEGEYEAELSTRGLEGTKIIKANATKPMYLLAEYNTSLIIRPWWWPYLPYAATAVLATATIGAYVVTRRKKVRVVVAPSELARVLQDAHELLEKGDYSGAIKRSAQVVTTELTEKLDLSKPLTREQLVGKVAEARKDLDPQKLDYLLALGERSTFARYRPRKDEAEKALRYSQELLELLKK
jgi:hypothetical protein